MDRLTAPVKIDDPSVDLPVQPLADEVERQRAELQCVDDEPAHHHAEDHN